MPKQQLVTQNLNQILSCLKANKAYLAETFHVNYIGIFGSMVRGDFQTDSDIDILVELAQPLGLKFVDLADHLEQLLNHRVDLVSRGAVSDRMWPFIEEELINV